MDAFEQLVAEILWCEGYWVQTSVKVALTKDEKKLIGRPSCPKWEVDVVAYKASTNELLALECKSFLDSRGVQFAELQDGHLSTRYKLFREEQLRKTVLGRLEADMALEGKCAPDPTTRLGMVAAKVNGSDEPAIAMHFAEKEWIFYGPKWLRERLAKLSCQSYDNRVSSIVAKLLLRV